MCIMFYSRMVTVTVILVFIRVMACWERLLWCVVVQVSRENRLHLEYKAKMLSLALDITAFTNQNQKTDDLQQSGSPAASLSVSVLFFYVPRPICQFFHCTGSVISLPTVKTSTLDLTDRQ